ncbi:MAG: MBL fold metallo-hydrolase [Acidobacteria bacterium]|nr:MAG: MBL fold metallo-hydrolase [Acidobacteriota bacterium]
MGKPSAGGRAVRGALVALSLAAFCGPTLAQGNPADVPITSVEVAPGLYVLQHPTSGNVGVSVGEDGIILVDDQIAPLSEKLKEALKKISDRPIRFLLNTHWHGDHTGGNEAFGKAGVVIVAHDNVRVRMSSEQVLEAFGRTVPASPPEALPVVTFNDAVTFHVNGGEIHAYHVPPAHTDGDAVVEFRQAGAVHMGDLYFNGMYPFIDVSSGGSIDGVIAAASRVLAGLDDDATVIPGHGPLSTKAELTAYRDMLQAARTRVARLIAAGKSADEIVAEKPLADYDEAWGKGFINPEQFLRIIYDSLTAKR